MRKLFLINLIVSLLCALAFITTAGAQSEELDLSFSRDFGYSSGGGDIQGLFTATITGPENLSKVVLMIDDQVMTEMTQPPYKFQFTTDNYPMGIHKFQAIGITADGKELTSRVIAANFVSAEEGWQAAGRIAIPLFVVVFGAMLIAAVAPMITGRKTVALPAGTPRNYPLGGGICPKCQRPFAVHIYGMNLLMSKYDRCPYCGKWSIVRLVSLDKLREAEHAELERANEMGQVQGMTEAEKLKKELDDSRYQNS